MHYSLMILVNMILRLNKKLELNIYRTTIGCRNAIYIWKQFRSCTYMTSPQALKFRWGVMLGCKTFTPSTAQEVVYYRISGIQDEFWWYQWHLKVISGRHFTRWICGHGPMLPVAKQVSLRMGRYLFWVDFYPNFKRTSRSQWGLFHE